MGSFQSVTDHQEWHTLQADTEVVTYQGVLPGFLKALTVDGQSFFLRHECGQVHRETVRVVQTPRDITCNTHQFSFTAMIQTSPHSNSDACPMDQGEKFGYMCTTESHICTMHSK